MGKHTPEYRSSAALKKNVVDSLVAAGMKGRNDKVINVLDKARRKALYQRVSRNLINELYG